MAVSEELDYLDKMSGQGFEDMTSGDITVPRLLISQALSKSVSEGVMKPGVFYNSITNKDYGTEIRVVVCHFQKTWVEWKPNQGGYVGTYPVGGLDGVEGDNFTGMTHTAEDGTKNIVIETWNYLVILPDHPEDGYMLFSSTRGNLKYLKAWNTKTKFLTLPSGRPAPLFSSIWKMTIGKDQNKAGNVYYSCNKDGKSSIVWDSWVTKEMLTSRIQPAREIASNVSVAAIADNREELAAIEAPAEDTTEF